MKVLLYSEAMGLIGKSGIGKSLSHQMKALDRSGVSYTIDPKDSYDLVHINTVGPKSYCLAREARKKNKKVVYHAHSTEEDFRNSFLFSNAVSPYFKKWLIKCYSTGDCIITPTPYSKSLLEQYGITKKIYPVSNGVELEFFQKDEEKAREFREKFHFAPEDKVVMAVGLYLERKGILDFVELAQRMPEYKFIWFGYTPLYTVPSKIKKAVKTPLPNLFFPGYVDSSVLRTAYSGANLFVFPTYEETEGIVLLEALASRQNVLIRDIPIYRHFEDGKDLYKARNIDEFQARIQDILEHRCPDLTQAGFELAEDRALEKTGNQLKEIYTAVLNQQ